MRRKCTTIGEIAVVEMANSGVQTRATAAAETVQKKRRRSNDDEEAEDKVTSSTTSYVQLRKGRILVDHHCGRNENRFLSNFGSSEKRIVELPDLEDESSEVETYKHLESWRETTQSSELPAEEPENQLDSTSTPLEANSRRRSTVEKMPSEAELEQFFGALEEKPQKEFAEKYNYDIVKDEPLEGRYEWVRLKS
ncbi:hypothetical protein PTKIN_Ptkin08bG0106000 [Pterospermum kingtungense]